MQEYDVLWDEFQAVKKKKGDRRVVGLEVKVVAAAPLVRAFK